MYGFGDTKSVHVKFCLWLVLLDHLNLVGTSLRCYSSEQDQSVECDDDDALCFTVCNRNVTIQGCSWGSCTALFSMFPHITDCLHCTTDNCNIAPCLDGKQFAKDTHKTSRQYVRGKNSTKYKLLWPKKIEWSGERYTHKQTKTQKTTTENPEKTEGCNEQDPNTAIEGPSGINVSVDTQNETSDPNRGHAVNDTKSNQTVQVVSDNDKKPTDPPDEMGGWRSGLFDFSSVNKLEKILIFTLLFTLCPVCLLSILWVFLCNWKCQCSESVPYDEKLPNTCGKRENNVKDNLYSEYGHCGPGKYVDQNQMDDDEEDDEDDDCRTKNYSTIEEDRTRVHGNFETENQSRKKHHNRDHCGPEVYKYSSANQDTASISSSNSSCLQSVPEKAVLPANNPEFKQHKVLSKGPMGSSVRFLLVPGYYIQNISMTALQALASRRERSALNGRKKGLDSKRHSRQRHSGRKRNHTFDCMRSSGELQVRYMQQFF